MLPEEVRICSALRLLAGTVDLVEIQTRRLLSTEPSSPIPSPFRKNLSGDHVSHLLISLGRQGKRHRNFTIA